MATNHVITRHTRLVLFCRAVTPPQPAASHFSLDFHGPLCSVSQPPSELDVAVAAQFAVKSIVSPVLDKTDKGMCVAVCLRQSQCRRTRAQNFNIRHGG